MRLAYFDCFAGAAGDMLVAALLDAGLDFEFLKSQIAALGIPQKDLTLKVSQVKRAGLRAVQFIPVITEQHHHRHLEDIKKIINDSGIGEKPKHTALTIFERLAQAEAAVHGKEPNEIHFHEVGAIDSIVDIVSSAIGLDALKIDKVYCSPLSVGGGWLDAAHGRLPVPAPAAAELLKGVPTIGGPIEKELLTPTAAAILTTVVEKFGTLPEMKLEKIGYGAGTLDCEHLPNVLRLIIGESVGQAEATADTICLLETNIDDVSGEIVASVMNKLFEQGALDVYTTAITMKQNRPASKLSVLCEVPDVDILEKLIFKAGLTFGIRRQIMQRSKLAREFVSVHTKFGDINIKVGKLDGQVVNTKPEFSDCLKAADEHKIPVRHVIDAALRAFNRI
ncbi:MAG: nickel pincer cofactor biosynthesis protein LarC [Sedimentisphaerales bacterium]|nr:nickel pincer cofactor biosynthesis protein LarC [Sedimentisphaerales bacterium]